MYTPRYNNNGMFSMWHVQRVWYVDYGQDVWYALYANYCELHKSSSEKAFEQKVVDHKYLSKKNLINVNTLQSMAKPNCHSMSHPE